MISEKYRELTGLRASGYTRAPAGAFFEYGYYQFGVPSFSTPGWGLPGAGRPAGMGGGAPSGGAMPAAAAAGGQRAGGARGAMGGMTLDAGAADAPEGIDLRLLQWMDAEKIDGFVKWTAFKHPTLGDVEIGGFKPYVTTNPPAGKIAELGAAHAKFAVYLSSLYAKVAIAKTEVTALGAGLFRIKADIENSGYLPTAMSQGVQARAVKPVVVQLGVAPESIITGNQKTTQVPTLAGSGTPPVVRVGDQRCPGIDGHPQGRLAEERHRTATLTLRRSRFIDQNDDEHFLQLTTAAGAAARGGGLHISPAPPGRQVRQSGHRSDGGQAGAGGQADPEDWAQAPSSERPSRSASISTAGTTWPNSRPT